jgi:hypothetical protein
MIKVGDSRVSIAHWWPSREFDRDHYSPIPSFIRHRAYQRGSRYMTMVHVVLPQGHLATYAKCCAKDQPDRAKGRFIALLRMARLLKSMGLRMEKA